MKTSIEALRIALHAADHTTIDLAVETVVYYIHHNKPFPEELDKLLAPIEGDDVFNEKLGLVKAAVGLQ